MAVSTEFVEPGILLIRPDGALTIDDIAAIRTAADGWLATHGTLRGVMVETRVFPGWADLHALADHIRFIADHAERVRRVALATDSALAPVAQFLATNVAGVEFRHFAFNEDDLALAWLRDG